MRAAPLQVGRFPKITRRESPKGARDRKITEIFREKAGVTAQKAGMIDHFCPLEAQKAGLSPLGEGPFPRKAGSTGLFSEMLGKNAEGEGLRGGQAGFGGGRAARRDAPQRLGTLRLHRVAEELIVSGERFRYKSAVIKNTHGFIDIWERRRRQVRALSFGPDARIIIPPTAP